MSAPSSSLLVGQLRGMFHTRRLQRGEARVAHSDRLCIRMCSIDFLSVPVHSLTLTALLPGMVYR